MWAVASVPAVSRTHAQKVVSAVIALEEVITEAITFDKADRDKGLRVMMGSVGIALGIRMALANPGQARAIVQSIESMAGGGAETLEHSLREIGAMLLAPIEQE